MTEYEIGRLLAEQMKALEWQSQQLDIIRNESRQRDAERSTQISQIHTDVLGLNARMLAAESDIRGLKTNIAKLEASDITHDALLDTGKHDISRMQELLKAHEKELAQTRVRSLQEGARGMVLPAGGIGALLAAAIAALIRYYFGGQ